jgi:hypothetical protein
MMGNDKTSKRVMKDIREILIDVLEKVKRNTNEGINKRIIKS